MKSHGLASWKGAGTASNPYLSDVLPLSWVWRAKVITLGMSCWDKDTGELSSDVALMTELAAIVNGAVMVVNTGSCALMESDQPEWSLSIIQAHAPDLPVRAGEVSDFLAFALGQQSILLARLTSAFPTYDWTTPVTGAVEVIDKCRDGSAEALRLWEYYRDILNPNLATPEGPAELYLVDGTVWKANIARCLQVASTPDTTSNRVMRCELAYRLIIFTDAVDALSGP